MKGGSELVREMVFAEVGGLLVGSLDLLGADLRRKAVHQSVESEVRSCQT
jgi:hypothetical protein